MISDSFSKEENIKNIVRLESMLNVIGKLNAFTATTQHIKKEYLDGFNYYILIFNLDTRETTINLYKANQINEATLRYMSLEKTYPKGSQYEIVLVSGDSIKSLQKAYPNYFADTAMFVRLLKRILSI